MHGSLYIAPSVLIIEHFLKGAAEKKLEYGKDTYIAGGHIKLKRIHNPAAMMSRFTGHPDAVRRASCMSAAVIAALYAYALARGKNAAFTCGTALVLGGAASNVFDRVKRGHVVDYLVMGKYVWNLSDLAIIAGTLLAVTNLK